MEILKYPDITLQKISGFVRDFDNNLKEIVEDLIEFTKNNNLRALASIQVGIDKKIIIFKKDNQYIPLINPTIYFHKGVIKTREKDESIPNAVFNLDRFKEVKIMYYDLDNNQNFLTLVDDDAVLIQRKIDYTFGGLPVHKLPKKEKIDFFRNYGVMGENCPTYFIKDKILKVLKLTIVAEFIFLLLSFFIEFFNFISIYNNYILIFNILFLAFYAIYARYETSKYKNCTSCQNANIIGTSSIYLIGIIIEYIVSIF